MASGTDKEEKKKGKSFFSRFSFRKKNEKKKDKMESPEEECETSFFGRIRQSFSKKKKKIVVEDEGRHSPSELVVSGDRTAEFSGGPRRSDILGGCDPKNSRPTTKTSKPLNPSENAELVTQPSENLNANTASCTLECHQPSSITQDTCQSVNDELPSSFSSIPAEPVGSSASPTTASICTGNNQSKPSVNKELPQSFSSVPAIPVPDGTLPTTQSQISSKKDSKEQMIEDQLPTSISAGKSQSNQEQPSQSLTNDSNNTRLKSIQPTTQNQMPADDLSMDATGMPSTSTPTEQLPQNKTQKSSVPAPESETSSETSSESSPEIERRKKKSTNKNRNTHIQYIKAKKVQTGDRSIMNVHDYREGGGKIPTIGKVKKNKDEKKKSKTLIQHIDAKELQTGSNAVMSVTLYPKNADATVYTSGAGDEAASNRCKEFLKPDGQGAFTKPQIQAMNDTLKSVGCIYCPGVSGTYRGTVFLVGPSGHYIFTAWHIVEEIISVNQLGASNSHDLNKLNSDDVYVDFSDDRSATHKYLLKPLVIYYDKTLDVALLQLQETTGHGNNVFFPQTLSKFSTMENVTEVAILGHGNPDGSHGVIADTKCEVIRGGSSLLQEAIQWFNTEGRALLQQSGQFFTTDDLRSPYDKVTNGNSIVCNSYITNGASGSPMVTMMGTVVGVYTCGIPGSYWRIRPDLQSRFPEKYVFGCGTTMVAVYKSMLEFIDYGTGQLTADIMQDIFTL